MTYQPITGVCVPPIIYGEAGTALSISGSQIIDADGEAAGGIYISPVTDTLTKIGVFTSTITTGDTLDVRVETVGADGLPTGTLWAANTNAALVLTATDDNTFFEVTLTAGASLTRGDLFAVVVERSAGGTYNGRINFGPGGIVLGVPATYGKTTSWSKVTQTVPNFSLYFSTAGYAPFVGAVAIDATTLAVTMTSATNPDQQGNVINLPYDVKASGVWFTADLDGDCTVRLYDSDGVTVLASLSVDADVPSTIGTYTNVMYFSADVTLSANTDYYVGIEAATGSNVAVTRMGFPTAAIKGQCSWFQFVERVTTKDPTGTADWTVVNDEACLVGLVLSEIDIPAAGGTTGIARLTGGGLVK